MNGKKVVHKKFGEGEITSRDDISIYIKFGQVIRRFPYPTAFEDSLIACDHAFMEKIKVEIKQLKEKEDPGKDIVYKPVWIDVPAETVIDKGNKKSKKLQRMNIAFKCNYCDGGKETDRIGFNGICSVPMIENNIAVEQHVWCSDKECPCRQYYEGDITRRQLEQYMQTNDNTGFVCYESALLRDWRFFAGVIHTGQNRGKPMKLLQVQSKSLAVFTTRAPRSHETTRFIFAVFLVDDFFEGDNRDEGFVTTKSEFRMELAQNEACKILFWKYYANEGAPDQIKFGSGLHRYMSREQGAQILRDIVEVKKGTPDEDLSKRFYEYFCRINGINKSQLDLPKGALTRVQK